MYQIGYIGRWESIPEVAVAVYDHDYLGVKKKHF